MLTYRVDKIKMGQILTYASVTSNKQPLTILTPVQFLARKAEWRTHMNFTLVPLFSWSHQATGFLQLETAARSHFFQINCRINTTPCNTCTGIVWVPHGTSRCVQYHMSSVRVLYAGQSKPADETLLVSKSGLNCSVHHLSTLSGYDICSSWHYHH